MRVHFGIQTSVDLALQELRIQIANVGRRLAPRSKASSVSGL
jgi:hypothetical protein